jgi:hypothetical protein
MNLETIKHVVLAVLNELANRKFFFLEANRYNHKEFILEVMNLHTVNTPIKKTALDLDFLLNPTIASGTLVVANTISVVLVEAARSIPGFSVGAALIGAGLFAKQFKKLPEAEISDDSLPNPNSGIVK